MATKSVLGNARSTSDRGNGRAPDSSRQSGIAVMQSAGELNCRAALVWLSVLAVNGPRALVSSHIKRVTHCNAAVFARGLAARGWCSGAMFHRARVRAQCRSTVAKKTCTVSDRNRCAPIRARVGQFGRRRMANCIGSNRPCVGWVCEHARSARSNFDGTTSGETVTIRLATRHASATSPRLAHVATGSAAWPTCPPTTKRPDVGRRGRFGPRFGLGSGYSLPVAANKPRSVFLNRESFPRLAISRINAAKSVACGVLPPGLVQ